MLGKLRADGVNPEFLWNPLVTDWRGPSITEMDEGAILEMRLELSELRREVMKLRDENKKLLDYVEELKGGK